MAQRFETHSASGYVAYKDEPREQESVTGS